tara:strand:- start:379 stop:837 length:459 start_codon:yes stop_codon:yes gene_type:complete
MSNRRTYDHLPEWDKLRISYSLAQLDFNPPDELGIGVGRVLNITEGFGYRGGLQFLSIMKFKKLIQALRDKYNYLMRQNQLGKAIEKDEEFIYGKSNRNREKGGSEGEHNKGRNFCYGLSPKVSSKLDRRDRPKREVEQVNRKVRDDAPRLF